MHTIIPSWPTLRRRAHPPLENFSVLWERTAGGRKEHCCLCTSLWHLLTDQAVPRTFAQQTDLRRGVHARDSEAEGKANLPPNSHCGGVFGGRASQSYGHFAVFALVAGTARQQVFGKGPQIRCISIRGTRGRGTGGGIRGSGGSGGKGRDSGEQSRGGRA